MIKELKTIEELDELASMSAPTWEGLSLNSLEEQIKAIDPDAEICYCTGHTYNEAYGLTGTNRYPEDLTIVFLKLPEGRSLDSMMQWKFQYGCRWADDVRDNNLAREETNEEDDWDWDFDADDTDAKDPEESDEN